MGLLLHKNLPCQNEHFTWHLTALCLWHGGWITGCHSLGESADFCSRLQPSPAELLSVPDQCSTACGWCVETKLRAQTGVGVWPWPSLAGVLTHSPVSIATARPVRELNTLYWTPLQANTAAPRWAELGEHICQVVYSVPRTQAHRQQQSGVDIMNYVNQGY